MSTTKSDKKSLLLGKRVDYPDSYSPELLCSLPRLESRHAWMQAGENLPFTGFDIWNAYEISWLNSSGKPEVAIGRFVMPCDSSDLIESKSLKLYLNSLNQTVFESIEALRKTLVRDLSNKLQVDVSVELVSGNDLSLPYTINQCVGQCLDDLEATVTTYSPDKTFLVVDESSEIDSAVLFSNLLKTNCPVTGQPDWATLIVSYTGKTINPKGLLKYICSYRQHSGFHEQCVEQIFIDILTSCKPDKLSVQACYTRRGGIEINPFRTNCDAAPIVKRLLRQ